MNRLSSVIALATFLSLTPFASAADPAAMPPKYALLVGCTKYPNHPQLRSLYGPANDVAKWNEVLTTAFQFPAANITRLSGWDEDKPETRPTAANIKAGFEALIAKASGGAQIVVVVSGHGLQVPLPPGADPLDPNNYEPDGLDEVFLPADVSQADGNGQLTNAIPDNQFGKWLDKLRAKETHVLIVFDCCHSGTMTRGGPDAPPGREINRAGDPAALGITPEQIQKSIAHAQEAVRKAGGVKPAADSKVKPSADGARGSLVAIYAAQPFEEAPELPLPEGAEMRKENYYGLLSFTVLQTIAERQSTLSYQELYQVITAHYRSVRGARGPVPSIEGDLNREVLGIHVWPERAAIILSSERETLKINAGELRGITKGSILSVHSMRVDPMDPRTIIGHVRVQSTTASDAIICPIAFETTPLAAAAELVKGGTTQCRLVARDYGDLRVKLFLTDHPVITAGLMAAEKETREMIRQVGTEGECDWVLRPATPKEAFDLYQLVIERDSILLVRGETQSVTADEAKAEAKKLKECGRPAPRRVFGVYPTDPAELGRLLDRDLPKIFKWQNVWRVAMGVKGQKGGAAHGVTFSVVGLKDENDKGPGELLKSGMVPNKTVLGFTVKNEGPENVWVAGVYLDSEMGIYAYEVIPVESGKTGAFTPGVIEKDPGEFGTEGMVVFVLPQSVQPNRPDFKFLEQLPLKKLEARSRGEVGKGAPKTPFGELLRTATLEPTRSPPRKLVNSDPGVLVQSWVITP